MIEEIILENLINNPEFLKRTIPFLKKEYFHDRGQSLVFEKIADYVTRHNLPPTQDELIIEIKETKGISQADYEAAIDLLGRFAKKSRVPSLSWLIEQTEKFCKDKALYNAIVEAASMIDSKEDAGKIPDLIKNALSVSFENAIGHEYVSPDMIEQRYKTLHQTIEYKIPFDIDVLNEVTNGGLPRKTLTIVSASTGAGKSLFLCHCAANNLLSGKNVLYITLEMSEEMISERIDANLMNLKIQDLYGLSLQSYKQRLKNVLDGCKGRLIIKEYPTSSAGVLQFRALLNELELKRDFKPDIIYVDYINICSSSRYKAGSVNSYQYIKAICEELRGLAIEYNLPIVSATQFNREGTNTSDVSFKEISESHGLAMTVDILWAMIRTEELDEQNLVLFKQLKNRFSDIASKLRFVVGIDRARMKLYNIDTDINMAKKPLSNGSPKPKINNDNELQQDYFSKERKLPLLKNVNKPRFTGIKVE